MGLSLKKLLLNDRVYENRSWGIPAPVFAYLNCPQAAPVRLVPSEVPVAK